MIISIYLYITGVFDPGFQANKHNKARRGRLAKQQTSGLN